MARLYLFAEGETERRFADTLLKPHLAGLGVYLHRPRLIAHAKRRGRVHRGGGRNYEAMRNDILRLLAQEKAGDVLFTTMIDLYALASPFPRRDEAEALRHDPFRRVEFLEQSFAEDIKDSRFISYIQLHEFEALLFSDPLGFACYYAGGEKQAAALQAIADQYGSPELIDDDPITSPSKRIMAQFPVYSKPIAGPLIADVIGLQAIRAKCPHFHAWLSRLESLGP
jgi:Domain of unknown function (DUF4276)